MSRGLDNNNAGNIKQSAVIYQGEKLPSRDPVFKEFISPAWGYRAIFVLLRYYIGKDFNTIKKIFTRYDPVEFKTYIAFVVKYTGIPENKIIDRDDWVSIGKIVAAISRMENGVPAITSDVVEGMNLAKSGQSATTTPKQGKNRNNLIMFALFGSAMWGLYELSRVSSSPESKVSPSR